MYFGRSFMSGSCSLPCITVLKSRLSAEVVNNLLKRNYSIHSSLLESLIVLVRSKFPIPVSVVVSVSCIAYSFVNHVVGISAFPMLLCVFVMIVSLYIVRLRMWVVCDCMMLMCCG